MSSGLLLEISKRDGTPYNQASLPATFTVNSMTWSVLGGPLAATVDVLSDDHFAIWEIAEFVRYGIKIKSYQTGKPVWWGYVNGVSVDTGNQYGVELDTMYNRVMADYALQADGSGTAAAAVTTYAEAADSIAEYGAKELTVRSNNVSTALAENDRDTALAAYKYPQPSIIPGRPRAKGFTGSLRLAGWWKTLDWIYYICGDTAYTSQKDQILAMISQCEQFFGSVEFLPTASILTSPARDGSQTGRAEIETLMKMGSNLQRWILATVNEDLTVTFSDEPARAPGLILYPDGSMRDAMGNEVLPETGPVGVWLASSVGAPATLDLSRLISPFPAFITEASWSPSTGYRPVTRGYPSPYELLGGTLR